MEGVGDVNGDQIEDLAISGSSAAVYVLFGALQFPPIINVNISHLDGTNGFAIVGMYDRGGVSTCQVSGNVDLSNDTLKDII